jgi:aldehyde dehydrogenase (NAD+)
MNSLVGALSSGCCALLKPSPYAPETAKVMEFLIRKIFPPEYVDVVQGGREVNELLLQQRFDFIFFTGSPAVGKVVMRAASEHLTKVVLELGGKSPCIVDAGADIAVAAQRIIWGKTINAGQTCIAPDYLFVHRSVKVQLIEKIKESVERMFGKDVQQSKFYPRIVHDQAFLRLEKYLLQGNILVGGQTDRGDRFIAPTVMDKVDPASPLMQDEIFGPILPVMEFDNLDEVIQFINQREKPLAFYYFGKNDKAKEIFARTTSGGGCINDTLMHITNHHMPFGGVGNSGLGKYHGRESFLAFSNARAVVSTPVWIDLPMKYPPFKYFNLVRKIV